MRLKQTLSFDDVLLVPKSSDILSRKEVTLECQLGSKALKLPVVSSPMDTVTEVCMASTMLTAGGLGILHRYNTADQQVALVHELRGCLEEKSADISSIAVAVSAGERVPERRADAREPHHRADGRAEPRDPRRREPPAALRANLLPLGRATPGDPRA